MRRGIFGSRGRIRVLVAGLATVTLALTGCGGNAGSGEVTITFWHGMGGAIAPVFQKIVDDFNKKNAGKIKVVPTSQGNYDDSVTKIKASLQSSDSPNLAQIYEVGTQVMIDTKMIAPAQDFIDDEDYPVDDIQAPFREYYTVDHKLRALPLNGSTPILYYNRDAFTKAGLDPDKPPTTLAELQAAAKKLTIKSGGKVTQHGFGAALYGWFLEQFAATSGALYCDHNNGRDGHATQINLTSPQVLQAVDGWADMAAKGYAVDTGRTTTAAENAFMAGRMAITFDSAGLLGSFQKGSSFEVGTAPYPSVGDSAASGPVVGGAALWILNNHPEAEQRAAWTFAKYLASPKTQAALSAGTGFVPINTKALDQPVYKKFLADNPAFNTAIKQVKQSTVTPASRGCLLGVMPQLRQTVSEGMEKAIANHQPAKRAMSASMKKAEKTIGSYNESVD